jgi:plasmid stabilization system protein ParE
VRLGFHPEAVAELRAAAFWYDERRAGLGDEFVDEVNRLGLRIVASPATYVQWPGLSDSSSTIRRALVDRFPYVIAFEVREQDVFILAVAHAKRRPLYWVRRVGHVPI